MWLGGPVCVTVIPALAPMLLSTSWSLHLAATVKAPLCACRHLDGPQHCQEYELACSCSCLLVMEPLQLLQSFCGNGEDLSTCLQAYGMRTPQWGISWALQ